MVQKPIFSKVLTISLHVCGWALMYSLPFFLMARGPLMGNKVALPPWQGTDAGALLLPMSPLWFKVETVLINTLLAIFFYANIYVFIPKILTRRGWWSYLLVVLASLLVYLGINYSYRLYFMSDGYFRPPFIVGIPNFFMLFGLSLSLRLIQDRARYEALIQEREHEKLKSELSFLRSQVSPHFMFNILNSLASLARKKSDQVESAIIQLSQLMRYSLYHTDKKVTLAQEADYLNNYIHLQKLRFGAMVNMHFHVDISRREQTIEPMLLVPFVENAFKHGVGLIQDPVIIVLLESTETRLSFTVRNKFNPAYNETKDSSSGIGLPNVRRRLDLLYRDQYTLNTYVADENWFVVELKLNVL